MFASKTWARIALALNVFGTVLLFYSFQATSSDMRIVTTRKGETALCVNNATVISSGPSEQKGTTRFSIGKATCPQWEDTKPAAVVNVEHPRLVTLGFSLTFVGFVIQFFSVPSLKTEKELRAEIRRVKLDAKSRAVSTQN